MKHDERRAPAATLPKRLIGGGAGIVERSFSRSANAAMRANRVIARGLSAGGSRFIVAPNAEQASETERLLQRERGERPVFG
jgi:hypothetical protein